MTRPPRLRSEADKVIRALADQLETAGVPVLDARACSHVGLLLISGELVVWFYGRLLHWRQDNRVVTWPGADAYGAARRLAEAAQVGPSRM